MCAKYEWDAIQLCLVYVCVRVQGTERTAPDSEQNYRMIRARKIDQERHTISAQRWRIEDIHRTRFYLAVIVNCKRIRKPWTHKNDKMDVNCIHNDRMADGRNRKHAKKMLSHLVRKYGLRMLCYSCAEYTLHVLNSISRDIVHMPLFQMQIQTEPGICLHHEYYHTQARVYYKLDIQ